MLARSSSIYGPPHHRRPQMVFQKTPQAAVLPVAMTNDCTPNQVFRDKLAAIIPDLRAFARGLCGTRHMADSIALDTMRLGWDERASFVSGTSFKTWIFRILRNHFHAVICSKGRIQSRDPAMAAGAPPEALLEQDGIPVADIARALQNLPIEQREILLLVVAHGMPETEAANVVGCTVKTVEKRLARGRKAFVLAATSQAATAEKIMGNGSRPNTAI